jgi:hypothetical protein
MKEYEFTRILDAVNAFSIKYGPEIAARRRLCLSDGVKRRNRAARLSEAEIIAIMIGFHLGAHRCFKHYYLFIVKQHYAHLFPGLVSYNRFIELQARTAVPFMMFLKYCCLGECSGISFIDSTPLRACHSMRSRSHKVFNKTAKFGKTSTGWFFGFKLHLIINEKGEILSFYLTPGNTDDRNPQVIKSLTKKLFGKLFGDRGYISKALVETLFADGIQLVTRVKKNMKSHILSESDRLLLRKRAVIESVNDELKNICQAEHTRHRSGKGFLFNLMAALSAYSFFPKKPSLNIVKVPTNQLFLAYA